MLVFQMKAGLSCRRGFSFNTSTYGTEAHVLSGHRAVPSLPDRVPILSLRPFLPGKTNTPLSPTLRVYSRLFSLCLPDRVDVNKNPALIPPNPREGPRAALISKL